MWPYFFYAQSDIYDGQGTDNKSLSFDVTARDCQIIKDRSGVLINCARFDNLAKLI